MELIAEQLWKIFAALLLYCFIRLALETLHLVDRSLLSNIRNMYSSYGSTSSGTSSKYRIKFGGQTIETTVTDKAAVANEWASHMLSKFSGRQTVVGLDNEWRPNFSPYTRNKSATLQLCIDNSCLIVQLFHFDKIPHTLKTFLASSNFIFVGVEVAEDISKLKNEYRLNCTRYSDIRDVAKNKWPGRFSHPGLKELASEICGLHMPKPKHVSLSNWEARVLSEAQVEYACIDAYASYKIGYKLLMEN